MMEAVGFTGTRNTDALTGKQMGWLWDTLSAFHKGGYGEFHHGDCIGADSMAHHMALALGYHVVIHPPSDPRHRAFSIGGTLLAPKPYLERNKDIVNASGVMLALPGGAEKVRSGTWSTIRYTEGVGKTAHCCLPDGLIISRFMGHFGE